MPSKKVTAAITANESEAERNSEDKGETGQSRAPEWVITMLKWVTMSY